MKKDSMLYNIKLAVDVFNDCIAKEQKKHADTMDFIGKSFSGDYRERKKREENNRFTSEIKKLKTECREQTRADLGNIRTRIQNSVKLPDKPDKLNILKSLDSLSLSQAELDILASKSSAIILNRKRLHMSRKITVFHTSSQKSRRRLPVSMKSTEAFQLFCTVVVTRHIHR